MDEVSERCVLLKNLPSSCNEKNISVILDLAHGDFRFQDKYEKIHKHVELRDDIRWIILFRTRKDAAECIKSGVWECSVPGGSCMVKPDYCSGCIIPDEWLQSTTCLDDSDESWTLYSEDLEEGTLRSDDLFSSFVDVKKKTHQKEDSMGTPSKSTKRGRGVRTSFSETVKYENKFDDLFNEILPSGNENGDMEDEKAKTSGSRHSSFSEGNVSSGELFGSGTGKKDQNKQFSDSVRSADMFGSGNNVFESMQFSYNKDADKNADEEDNVLLKRHAKIKADLIENPELFGSSNIKPSSMSVMSMEMFGSGKNEKESSYAVKAENDETTETKDIIDQNHTETNVNSEKSDSDATDNTNQQIKVTESEGENITRRSSQNDSFATEHDLQNENKNDKQNMDNIIPQDQRQINTVPKPEGNSSKTGHNKTCSSSYKIENRNTSSNDPTVPVYDRKSVIQDCKVTEKNDVKVANMNDFSSAEIHRTSDDRSSVKYSDGPQIQRMHVNTSSTENSSARQTQTLNDAQNRAFDVPTGYPQFPGYFSTAVYAGHPPLGVQPYMPYNFNPNDNYRFPLPGYQAMHPIPQFPGFYPMVPPGFQTHGTMSPVYYFPVCMPHPGAMHSAPNVNNPEYSEITEESTSDVAFEKGNKNSERSQAELPKHSQNHDVEHVNDLRRMLDEDSRSKHDNPDDKPKPVAQRQTSRNEHIGNELVYDTPYVSKPQTSVTQPGINNTNRPEYDIPKKVAMETSDANELKKQEQHISTVTDTINLRKNWKDFDGKRPEHIYHEIGDIDDTINYEDEAQSKEGANKVHMRTEEANMPGKMLPENRRSGRALPPIPLAPTSDYSTVVKRRQTSDSKSPLRNGGREDEKDFNEDEKETGQRLNGGNRKILVKGLSDAITQEALELYFETPRIGGGDIESSEIDGKKRQAIIEYKSEIDAREVVKRATSGQKFHLLNFNLEVLEYVPPKMDPLKVFVQGIAKTTTDECIVNFIEGRFKLSFNVIRGETPGTAMLCFVKPPDFMQIRKMCAERKCEGKYWKISPVEQTRSIQVKGLSPEISKDSISLFFENKRRSDGGEVEQVVFRAENMDCIVTFMQAEDAERTCKKGKHILDGQKIEVQLYYVCLDLDEEYVVKIPAPITFEYLDDSIRKFLLKSPKYRSSIENGISSQYGRVVWEYRSGDNTCIQIECIVDPKDRHVLEKVKDWTENCTQIVNDVCDVMTVQRSHNIAVELWPELKSRLREISVRDPREVAVILADNECVVVVVGEGENVRNAYKQIEQIVDEINEKMKKENQEITKKVHFKKYEMALVRAARLDTRFKKDQVELSIDRDGTEIVFKGKQKDVDDALAKLKTMMKSFVSRTVPGFTREAKDLLFRKEARDFIKAKFNKEKIIGVWDVPRGSEVIMHSRNMKDLDKAVQILKESLKIDSIQLDPVKASVFRSGAGVKKLNDLKESHEGLFLYSLQQPEDEIHFACVEHLHNDIKSEIISFIDLNTIISQFLPTDIGTFSFIIQYKQKELDSIVKQFSRLAVSLTTVDKEQSPGFTVKGKKDGCRLAIIQLQQVIESVVHKDLKLPWPGFDKFVRSKEGSDEMKLIELNEKCVIKVFEDSTSNRRSQSEDSSSYKGTKTQNTDLPRHSENDSSASGIKKGIKKNVIPGSLAAEKADVIVNSTNSDLDMKVGAISRTLLKAGGDQLGLECKTKYPDGIKLGEIAVTTGGALNCKSLFHGVLTRWDGGQGQAERVMTHFIKACLQLAQTHKFESISFPALGTGMLGFPANVVAQIMNGVVDGFGVDNPNTSLKCVNFVIWHEDKATSKAFEDYTVNRRNIIRSRDGSSKGIPAMAAENIIVQGGNLQTTIDKVSISVEQGDITKTSVGAIVNSTMDDLNLNSGAISKAILLAAGSSIQREATAKKYKFDADGLVVTSQGQLTMCQKIIHIRARNGLNGWTSTIQDCLVETENLGLNSVAFPALGTGGKGVSADQMAKTMIEAFQDFIKSSKNKGSLRTIRVVIFDRKMLDTFVTVIKTALDPQQKKGFLHDFKFWERKSNVETAPITTVHIYAGSSHYLDRAVSKIEDIRREKDLFVISIVRKNFKESNAKDLQRIGYNNRVKVVVSSGCIKVMGYGKAADAAIREAQMYLKDLETDIRKSKETSTILLPLSWKGMNITDRTTVVGLPVHDLEYVKVAQRFSSECSFPHLKPNILTIERIQNPTLYTQFVGKKRQMEIINKAGWPVGRQLWHGTRTKEAVNNIIQKGFDRNYNSGSSYGVGVYFAVNAQMSLGYCSPDATGQQYILLADVLTGEYGQGSGGIRVPPNRPDGLTYDSTTDNVAAPSLFVIYHDAQAYPTYVITFR